MPRHSGRHCGKVSYPGINVSRVILILVAPSLAECTVDFNDRHEKFSVDLVVRAWNAVVAHDSAVSALSSRYCTVSAVLRYTLPQVSLIHAPMGSTTKSMDSIPHIMRSKVIPALKLNNHYAGTVEALISQHLSVTEFSGAIHCEASMMGVAYAFSHSKGDFTSYTSAFYDAFEVQASPGCFA
jgi:hypothetical protein